MELLKEGVVSRMYFLKSITSWTCVKVFSWYESLCVLLYYDHLLCYCKYWKYADTARFCAVAQVLHFGVHTNIVIIAVVKKRVQTLFVL